MTATKTIPKVLRAEGLKEIMDLSVYPFGNAYYATKECGKGPYDSNERHCWFNRCIAQQPAPDDCFPADGLVAQHGSQERDDNILEACAVKIYPDWQTSWPFIECMESKYQSKKALEVCAKKAGLDAEKIQACKNGPDGAAAEAEMAKATPDHPGVPWIIVDGKPLDNPSDLLKAICAAYTGDKPEGCKDSAEAADGEVIQLSPAAALCAQSPCDSPLTRALTVRAACSQSIRYKAP